MEMMIQYFGKVEKGPQVEDTCGEYLKQRIKSHP
jgi:hypothetical protein